MEKKLATIGARLQAVRDAKNLQPKDINEKTGISLGNLHALEHDKTKPSADALIKLAKLYDVTTDWILFGETNDENGNKNISAETFLSVSNLELAAYFSRIAEIWEQGDEETKSWVVVQLRRAFPEVAQKIKKK